MTTIMMLQETKDNRFSRVLKDERGLTMVELLATVVILAIIMGIGAVAIGQVIQNSKEDAAVSEAQSAYTAAKLYLASTLGANATSFSVADLTTNKNFEVGNEDVWGGTANVATNQAKVVFTVGTDGTLTVTIGDGALTAGRKTNSDAATNTTGLNSTAVAKLDRAKLKFQ